MSSRHRRALHALVAAALFAPPLAGWRAAAADPTADVAGSEIATPRAQCGPGSHPETAAQGRVPAADVASGRAALGYTCNTTALGHFGSTGGFKVLRYTDAAGHECAFYDSTLLFPKDVITQGRDLPGVYVLDMADPAHPNHTASLTTPAMLTPHESLSLNVARGLLAADMGNPLTSLGFVDVYDVSGDCRHPVLKSSLPMGILGHEGNFAPDGKTFYASSTVGHTLTAVDVSDPSLPLTLWTATDYIVHGMNISDDGNRLYFADLGGSGGGGASSGLTILDTSEVQRRVPLPKVPVVSHFTWPTVSIPQNAIPITIGGHRYLVEIDEYSKGVTNGYDAKSPVGAGRIIDIADDAHPRVISNLRLEVNTPTARAGSQQNDTGATSGLQGYAGHYCAVPQRAEPGIVACSFIMSGLRVFDIRDPYHPHEIAYFNAPLTHSTSTGSAPSNFAMSAPAFVPARGEIWYADGNQGFFSVRVTNGVWPFAAAGTGATAVAASPSRVASAPATVAARTAARLPATGGSLPMGAAALTLLAAIGLRRCSRVPASAGPGQRRRVDSDISQRIHRFDRRRGQHRT